MILTKLTYEVDLDRGVSMTPMKNAFLAHDKNAHQFNISCVRGREPVNLDNAGVTGYFIRPDGYSIIINGIASDNIASVTLPAECYGVMGRFTFVIKASLGESINTIFWAEGAISRSRTDIAIDPDSIVPSLDELLAQINSMQAATKEAWNAVGIVYGNADVAAPAWEQGYVSTSGSALGTEREAANFIRTDYISVDQYASLALLLGDGWGSGCVLYDAMKTPISGYGYSDESERIIDTSGAAYARVNLRSVDSSDIDLTASINITIIGRYTSTGTPLPEEVRSLFSEIDNLKDHTDYTERYPISPDWEQGYVSTNATYLGKERNDASFIRTGMIDVQEYGAVLLRLDEGWGCGYVLYDADRKPTRGRSYSAEAKQTIPTEDAAYIRINLRSADYAEIYTSSAYHVRIFGTEGTGEEHPLRILCLGNSWLRDSCVYLWSILHRAGINAVVGNAFTGNRGLRDFYYGLIDPTYTFNGVAVQTAWTYYKWTSDNRQTMSANTLQEILADEGWDIIVINNNVWLHGIPDAWTTDGNPAYTPSADQGDGSFTVNAFIALVKSAVEQAHDITPVFALMTPWTYADGTAMAQNASWMVDYFLDYHGLDKPQTQEEWDALFAYAHQTFQRTAPQLAALLGDDCIGVINLGEPIRMARSTGLYDDCGYKLQYNDNDYSGAKTAGTHLTEGIGRYITSMAMAYELCNIARDAVTWYPPDRNTIRTEGGQAVSKVLTPTSALATIGRRCAWVGAMCTHMQ